MSADPARLAAALAERYAIARELGQGGMATVYLAHDLKHDRKVALKVLKPELAAVLGAERFVIEIRTTAALQHPHILPLFDSGTADGFLYYVMPFIDGETLRAKLDRETQLGIDEALKLTIAVADALDYAHRHGVVHRDIKPENILLHDGRPMVADFGIALALSAAAGGRMTETGMSLGTPHYMSPEQATAEKEVTARSDIYSLASVLYEMLTGSPPHVGASAQQIIMKIVTEEAQPVTKLRKAVPPNVAAAVSQALEKLPADRFDSAKAFADALADPHFSTLNAASSVRAPTTVARRGVLLGLLGALATMTLLAAWALSRPKAPAPVIRYGLALPLEQQPAGIGFTVITSDGSRIVYVGPSPQPGNARLWVKHRSGLTATPLAGTEGATAAAISPDDTWIAFVQGGSLRKMPIGGGASVAVASGLSYVKGSVAWLDGGSILYTARDPVRIVSIPEGGGTPATLWSSDSLNVSNLTPLPGGRGVLFQACPAPCNDSDVWVLDLRSGSARRVVQDARVGYYLESRHLAYVGNGRTVMAAPFDLASLELRGAPVAVLDSISVSGGVDPYFTVAASGTLVMRMGTAPTAGRYTLVWVDRAGRETPVDSSWTFQVTQFAGNYGWALSPDGTRLAIGLSTAAGDDIWVKPLPRGPASRMTYGAGSEARPRWRSDGRSVVFVSTTGLHQRRADGTGADSVVWSSLVDEGVFSPDDRWLVIRRGATSAVAGGRDIYGIRTGVDSAPVPLIASEYDEMALSISPDGRWIAYQSDETGRIEVYVRPFPGTNDGKAQVSSDGATAPLWSRDGRELFFLSQDRRMMAVTVPEVPTLSLGEPRTLFRVPDPLLELDALYYTPWDVAADGRFIMARRVDRGPDLERPLIVVENWLEELKAKVPK